MEYAISGSKECSRCHETKSIDEFYCKRRSRDRKQCYCKDCQKDLARQWKRENAPYVSMRRRNGIRTGPTPIRCTEDFCH